MPLLVTGSIGIDNVTTPFGEVEGVLGGSAVYSAFAASPYTPVRLVAAVGHDFPEHYRRMLGERGIDLAGLEVRPNSRTFRWSGRFEGDMNVAETVAVSLNVLAEHAPRIPAEFADSEVVFLANSHPLRQREMLAQVRSPRLSVCDTMDIWIEQERDALVRTLSAVDGVIMNDAEARKLTGNTNLIEAAEAILVLGPRFVVIKKGEHGALMLSEKGPTVIPAYPTKNVRDPTGAGDSFAGGMLGYLASQGRYDHEALRRALLRGTVAASFVIEDFSLGGVTGADREQLNRRVTELSRMLRID